MALDNPVARNVNANQPRDFSGHRLDEQNELLNAYDRASEAFQMLGGSPPRPGPFEAPLDYRKRTLHELQKHLPDASRQKRIRVDNLKADVMFDTIEDAIFREITEAARDCDSRRDSGVLREIRKRSSIGRQMSEFVGDPQVCWRPFMLPSLRFKVNPELAKEGARGGGIKG